MAVFSRLPANHKLEPNIRFADSHGLILFDDWTEHRLFNPSLEAMLRRYIDSPESRSAARVWLDETHQYSPFGFVALCEYLDLDANYVRRGLIRWMNNVDRGVLPVPPSNHRRSSVQSIINPRTAPTTPLTAGSRPSLHPIREDRDRDRRMHERNFRSRNFRRVD